MYPGPVLSIFGYNVYMYGLCMMVGLLACFIFLTHVMTKNNFTDNAIDTILVIGIVAVALGLFFATFFQAVYDFIRSPEDGFVIKGSMTFQGGLVGGVSSFLVIYNLFVNGLLPKMDTIDPDKKVKFLHLKMNAGITDALPFIPIAITLAHGFGRLGCLFAGCCHGAETDAWFGIMMHTNAYGYAKVIPTQLFEAIFLFALSAVMAYLYFKRDFKCNMSVYGISYGIWRFLLEFVRTDYRGSFIGDITPSQFWSLVMIIGGIGYIFLYKYVFTKTMKHPELQEPLRKKKEKESEESV